MSRYEPCHWPSRALRVASALACVAFAATAFADDPAPPHHHTPPPEAFTACENHASGDVCSVNIHGNALAGTCASHPGETRLACRPNNMPQHGPPPEAFTACESHESGAACTVSLHGSDVAGTCSAPPGETRLACRPNNMPERPPQQ